MNLFQSFLLGILQGLTEFIPVSSSAHLLIGQKILGIPSNDAMFSFLVLVQLGTVLALIIYFWKDLWRILLATLSSIKQLTRHDGKKLNLDARLGWYIIIATIPALIFGYLLKSVVETLFKTPLLEAGIRLLITAVVLALADWLGRPHPHSRKNDLAGCLTDRHCPGAVSVPGRIPFRDNHQRRDGTRTGPPIIRPFCLPDGSTGHAGSRRLPSA